MEFKCKQRDLLKAINTISNAITVRTTLPILQGILLEVCNHELILSASDLDITIETKIDITDAKEGKIVVKANLFSDIIRKLSDSEISFVETNNYVEIKCLNSKFSIVGIPAEDFPDIRNKEIGTNNINLDKDIFNKMVRMTSFAASPDLSRGVMTGILMEIDQDEIRAISIDGFRMAIVKVPMISKETGRVIIPAKIMGEIVKTLSDAEEDTILLSLNEKTALIKTEKTKIVAKIIDGDFIDYKSILPTESKITVKVRRKEILESVERASLVSKEGKNNLIKIKLNENVMLINSESEEGKVNEEIIVEKTGEDIEIGFNAKFLTDVFRAISDEEIVLKMISSTSACIIEPTEGESYRYLILPVRL